MYQTVLAYQAQMCKGPWWTFKILICMKEIISYNLCLWQFYYLDF